MKRGHLFVLSGPSGAGKGTLLKALFRSLPDLAYSISCTTRPPRPGEREGVDYRFISAEGFEELAAAGAFLEEASVHGHRYGTLREDVGRQLEAGRDVVLEIDVQGARQIKRRFPEAVLLFVLPPSLGELERRLRTRGTENEESVILRLKNAECEMEEVGDYDHSIVNDDFVRAVAELRAIVKHYREQGPTGRGGKEHDLS